MADGFYRLTYRDIAERLGISPDAARMKANRKAKAGHWRLLPDETPGQERLVEIPAADIDDVVAKAAQAERSALAEQAEQAAPAQPFGSAEHPASAEQSAQPEQPARPAVAERSAVVELFVPPRVTVSFDPQHPHLPPAAAERSPSAQPSATPEHSAWAEPAEQAAPPAPAVSPEQAAPAEQAEQPAQAEQAVQAEQASQAEQSQTAEQAPQAEQSQAAEQVEAQSEPRSGDDDLEENAEGESGDALVSTLTARVTTLTNRLIEETNAREKASEELNASAVREAELKVEIERLCTRVSELTDALAHPHRPWWRRLIQGSSGD